MNFQNKIISLQSISKSFKDQQVLKDITFDFFEQENIALVGKNGSGKSTLIDIIANLLKPDKGEVIYYNNISSSTFLTKAGFMFQENFLPPLLKVKDYINFCLISKNIKMSKDEILKSLEILKIDKTWNKDFSKLSGGQKQKVNFFLSLLGKPKIVFLDEFLSFMDNETTKNVIEYLQDLTKNKKTTLIIVSHNFDSIEKLVDKVVALKDGKLTKYSKQKFKDLNLFL